VNLRRGSKTWSASFGRWLVAAMVVLAAGGTCAAQVPEGRPEQSQQVRRPASISRIVRHFDFEERAINPLDVPLYWYRAQHDPAVRQRPRYPIYNLGELDYQSPAATGAGSVRLDTQGGSVSLRLQEGVVQVFPSVRYAVGAMVRTEGIEQARPRLVARLLDADGATIDGTEREAVGPPTGPGEGFAPVLLELAEAPPNAVSLQIDLELAQPRELRPGERPEYALLREDFSGTVWFDDVVVAQLPTAQLRTLSPTNTFPAHRAPTLLATVRDLSGDPLHAELVVRDLDGRRVAHRAQTLEMGTTELSWTPRLPALGWYEASLTLRVGDTPMLRSATTFVWLPPDDDKQPAPPATDARPVGGGEGRTRAGGRGGLGLVAPPTPAAGLGLLPELVSRAGAGELVLPVPEPVLDGGGEVWLERARAVLPLLDRAAVRTTAVIAPTPDSGSASRISPGDLALIELDDQGLWDSAMTAIADTLGDLVDRWHIGPLGSLSLVRAGENDQRLARIASRLRRLMPSAGVVLPWDGAFAPRTAPLERAGGVVGLVARVPELAPEAMVARVASTLGGLSPLPDGERPEATLLVRPLDQRLFTRRAGVAHLADQMLALWTSPNDTPQPGEPQGPLTPRAGLALLGGWTWHAPADQAQISGTATDPAHNGGTGPVGPRPMPTPALAAFRSIGDRLAGVRFVRECPMGDGVRCLVFEPIVERADGSGGLLVLRAESGGRGEHAFELYLGEGAITAYDVFGNATPVPLEQAGGATAQATRPVHRVRVGDLPVFVENVDTDLLLFLASLRLEPDLLPAVDVEHEAALRLTNRWPTTTAVRIRVVSPGGVGGRPVGERSCEITPRIADVLLEGGQTQRTPLGIRFRRSELAGRKELGLELDLRGERTINRLRVSVPFTVGLPYLEVDANAQRVGPDVLVRVEVRNTGDRPLSLDLTALVPGRARQRAAIGQLAPGDALRRELLLRGVADAADDGVVLSVEDVDVGARLNYAVDLP